MEITRTFDLLDRYRQNFMKEDAFVAKENGQWINYSTRQYIDYAHFFAYGLLALGFKKGDKVATICNNRPEWNIVDMGMAMIGVIHVPLFTSLSATEYEKTLQHADVQMVLISDEKLLKTLSPVIHKIKTIKSTYTFDTINNFLNWMEVIELGRKSEIYNKEVVEKLKAEIKPNDFATLIYTSGTTGESKGVMLSHENLVKNFLAAVDVFGMTPDQKYLSILPLCHVGGRMGNYQSQCSGCTIVYAESMGTIANDMKTHRPHGFDAVPRILEKIFDSILAKGKKLKGIKKRLFFWAVKNGLKYKLPEDSGWLYKRKLKLADKLIFSKWREAIGGNVHMVGCGGASLQPRLERIFWAAGVKILNMYGLTETSPVITINRQKKPDLMLGSVGSVIDGVEVKIADDGEILCKGHNVMLGYYKDAELTKSVFTDDGWFKTGDIGYLEDGKFLVLKDRKKEVFKLSSGKFIAPQLVENKLKESLFVEQICVIGEHEKYASAIIAPNFSYIEDWAKEHRLEFAGRDELIQHPTLTTVFQEEIRKFNKNLSDFERITRYKLVPDEWSPSTGELSSTLKLKRRFIMEKYKDLIDQIYVKQSI